MNLVKVKGAHMQTIRFYSWTRGFFYTVTIFKGSVNCCCYCCSVTQSCPTLCYPRTAACQTPLSITNSWSLLKVMSIESVLPSNHLILCRPLLLPSVFPSIRGFSSKSVHTRWPKDWSFSIRPSNE